MLEALVLDSDTKSHLEVLIDDMFVVADIEVLHDVLEDHLARRATAFLEAFQGFLDLLAVFGMIGWLRFGGARGLLILRTLLCSLRRGGVAGNWCIAESAILSVSSSKCI